MQVLHGKVSPETAHEVDDYPYGSYRTRCRWWLDVSKSGSGRGKTRCMQQTANPKTSLWNKPHAGIYHDFAVLCLDDKQHTVVHGVHAVSGYSSLLEFVLAGLYDQLDDDEYDKLIEVITSARRYNPSEWKRFETMIVEAKRGGDLLYQRVRAALPQDPYVREEDCNKVARAVPLMRRPLILS